MDPGSAPSLGLPGLRLPSALADIRVDERRETLGAFLTLAGFMTGHALLETARDALFLGSLPASRLPWVYLTIAFLALALAEPARRAVGRVSTRHELSGWLMFAGVITLGFWLLVGATGTWIFYALYTWSAVLATLLVVRFWTILGGLFTLTQAKRLFAVIGVGSTLGAIQGSALAVILSERLPPRHLVLAAAVVFLVSSLAPALFRQARRSPAERDIALRPAGDFALTLRLVGSRPYPRRVAVIVLIATITFWLVDFIFKSTADRLVPAALMDQFFSTVYLTLNILSLLVQLLLVSFLIRHLGVSSIQALVPTLLLVGAGGFVFVGGLGAALVLKGTDASLRHSLYRTGTELLFVPLRSDLRDRIKPLIDVLGQRGGQALASVLILVGLRFTTQEAWFAAGAIASAGVWLYLVAGLKKHYLDVFRQTLNEELTETRIEFPSLDVVSLETLITSLNDPNDGKVLAALDLLADKGKARLIPALILYHPSPRVVVHALETFLRVERKDFLPVVERLLSHVDSEVRAACLRARLVLQPEPTVFRQALEDPSGAVRATALVGLVAGGWISEEERKRALNSIVEAGSPDAREALAKAVQLRPLATFERVLARLVLAPEWVVRIEAVRAIRANRSLRFVPVLVQLLGERSLREEVRETLVALGNTVPALLKAALADSSLPHSVRRHLPRTIAAFRTPDAARLLVEYLPEETDGMIRFKILRSLGKLRSEDAHLVLDTEILSRAMQQTMGVAFRFMNWRRAIEAGARVEARRRTPGGGLLVLLLKDKEAHALERLFRLINLELHNEELRHIYRGLESPNASIRASSRELVENLVTSSMREPLLELIDDVFEPTGGRAGYEDDDEQRPYEEILAQLLESSMESVSSLAAYHTGEIRARGLLPSLVSRPEFSPFHAEVVAQARAALDSEDAT